MSSAVTFLTDRVLVQNFIGTGVQWDPSDIFDYTDEQWRLFVDRIAFLRPSLVRCMSSAGRSYCRGVRGDRIEYDWENHRMRRLYRLLDVCQELGIAVMIGEWWSPGNFGYPDSDEIAMDDPRWGRILCDMLEHLVRARGYTCIRYFNCVNEPNSGRHRRGPGKNIGDPFSGVWGAAIRHLREEMDQRGFADIPIVGPDVYDDWDNWLTYSLRDIDAQIGQYEVHWYATRDQIRSGQVQAAMRPLREKIRKVAPEKEFFFAEMGCITGRNLPGDQQMELPKYWYGVAMADMLAQSIAAGMAGGLAWSFEDSMHLQRFNGNPEYRPSGDDRRDFSVKVWGFWNAVGKAWIDPYSGSGDDPEKTGYWMGVDDGVDMTEIRPWYFVWAPICHAFPAGASTLGVELPPVPGLRAAAALQRRGDGSAELGFFAVNHGEEEQSVLLRVPGVKSAPRLAVYEYFSEDSLSRDADGFPRPARFAEDADLSAGIPVTLPPMSVVLFTTADGGRPVLL